MTDSPSSVSSGTSNIEDQTPRRPRGLWDTWGAWFVALVVLLSGFASLVYQVAWQRVLTQEIGLDSSSMAIIVSIFMLGLGTGSLLGGRLSRTYRGNLARAYAGIEILTGIYGVLAIVLLRQTNALLASLGWLSMPVTFLANIAVMFVPIFLMGMTIPVIVQLLARRLDHLGRVVGLFYGLNIIGAALGALVSGLVLIEWLGLFGTTVVAAIINVTIGVLFLGGSSLDARRTLDSTAECLPGAAADSARRLSTLGLAAGILGMISLAYEVILFRVDSHFLASHVYVFPLMLAAYLVMMGLGNAMTGMKIDSLPRDQYAALISKLLVACAVSTLVVFWLPQYWIRQLTQDDLWVGSLLLIPISMLPILPLSGFFPVIVKLATSSTQHSGQRVGAVLFCYTMGNFVGCLLCAFILLGTLGTIWTTRLCLAGLLVAVMVCWRALGHDPRRSLIRSSLAVVVLVVAATLLPDGYYYGSGFDALVSEPAAQYYLREAPTEVSEDAVGVVQYHHHEPMGEVLANRSNGCRVFTDLGEYPVHEYNFSSLMVFDPAFRPRHILIIGIGPAAHVWGLVSHADVESITIVELSSETVRMVRKYSDPRIVEALDDPRVKLVVMDGRRYLQQAHARREKFDLIQLGTCYPNQAGSANLYSVDLMATAKACLTTHGYFVTLDCIGSASSAIRVFRQGLILEDMPLYAFFTDASVALAPRRRISRSLALHYTAVRPRETPEDAPRASLSPLRVSFLEGEQLRQFPLNSDNFPRFEYWLWRARARPPERLNARLYELAGNFVSRVTLEVTRASAGQAGSESP